MSIARKYGLKPVDSWWNVLVIDPLAVAALFVVHRWRVVTADRLSMLAVMLTIPTCIAFASGQLVLGAILYQVRFLIDCMDGKLARMRGSGSKLGWYLDHGLSFPSMLAISLCEASGLLSVVAGHRFVVALFVFSTALAHYALFALEGRGHSLAASRPIWGRFNARPTGPDFELLSFTAAPILIALDHPAGLAVFALGVAAQTAHALWLMRRQAGVLFGNPSEP